MSSCYSRTRARASSFEYQSCRVLSRRFLTDDWLLMIFTLTMCGQGFFCKSRSEFVPTPRDIVKVRRLYVARRETPSLFICLRLYAEVASRFFHFPTEADVAEPRNCSIVCGCHFLLLLFVLIVTVISQCCVNIEPTSLVYMCATCGIMTHVVCAV